MFIVKFTTGKHHGRTHIVHHAYAYAVDKAKDHTEPTMISLALRPDADIYDRNQTANFICTGTTFIMNDAGKTIEVIRTGKEEGLVAECQAAVS